MNPENIRIEFLNRDGTFVRAVGAECEKALATLIYVERNCFFNAIQNWKEMEKLSGYAELDLVAGSLGLCAPEPCWYEWGGTESTPHTTVAQFAKCPVTGLPDVHFWLQTPDGVILDVLDPYLTGIVAPYHKKCIDTSRCMHGALVRGTAKELESLGLRYVPADPLVTACMIKIRLRRNKLHV